MLPGVKKKNNFVNLWVLMGKRQQKNNTEKMFPTKTSEFSLQGALGHSEEQKEDLTLFSNIF